MRYNLYYNDYKINRYPLTKKQMDIIRGHDEIGIQYGRNNFQRIKTRELRVVKCIIVD